VRRRRDASRVTRRRVDLDALEGCPERRPQGLESLARATPVVGEPEPEHAQAVIRSCRDCAEILSIQAQGGTATPPDRRGHGRLAMTDATTDGSSAVASAKPPVKHIPTTPTPGPPHSR